MSIAFFWYKTGRHHYHVYRRRRVAQAQSLARCSDCRAREKYPLPESYSAARPDLARCVPLRNEPPPATASARRSISSWNSTPSFTSSGESPASHRGRRCALLHPTAQSPRRGGPGRTARRAQSGVPTVRLVHGGVQYREYLNEEQRSQTRGPQRGSRVGVEEECPARQVGQLFRTRDTSNEASPETKLLRRDLLQLHAVAEVA